MHTYLNVLKNKFETKISLRKKKTAAIFLSQYVIDRPRKCDEFLLIFDRKDVSGSFCFSEPDHWDVFLHLVVILMKQW